MFDSERFRPMKVFKIENMSKADEYRAHAQRARDLAAARPVTGRAELLQIAASYEALANLIERTLDALDPAKPKED
jgi:hypothetical protein